MTMHYIYKLGKIPENKTELIGGKAASLSRMITDLKVKVPGGYVICADAFENGGIKKEALSELRALIRILPENKTYAVRSSAIGEDGQSRSFAGQYETVTDVAPSRIPEAVLYVISSSASDRVEEYKSTFEEKNTGIGVVIQEFVKPDFAGVVFTSDVITGRDDYLVGNYVRGEGELLVSGQSNASVFRICSLKYVYEGDREFEPYARKLQKDCLAIRSLYGVPMDIEWAVSGDVCYILQARPITTLQRHNESTYDFNGTRSSYKILTRTNVGEIFMDTVSPMTMSVLDRINAFLGLPEWLDNVCGQAYMNISVMCSLMVSFGKSEQQAYEAIRDLVGEIPEGVKIPISPFDKRAFLGNLKTLLFPKEKSKLSKKQKLKMVDNLAKISRRCILEIRKVESNEELLQYWDEVIIPKLKDGLSSVLTACGTAMVPLFGTRKKLTQIAGEDMANRLLGGCVGILDSMKPLLLLEDVAAGKLSKKEYMKICGHRCVNEMELMHPRPYEDPTYPDRRLKELEDSDFSLHQMQQKQKEEYEKAVAEFKAAYPKHAKWFDQQIAKFIHANAFREEIRSKGVWIFCVFREFCLKAGQLNGLGDDVFMLHYDEMLSLLHGDQSVIAYIEKRKLTFANYKKYPTFPTLIIGRFDPDAWMADPDRRSDLFWEDGKKEGLLDSDIRGFAGAAGRVTGTVRVISDISHIDEIEKGDILVTVATNIGWTLAFPKVSAIVTDIGAPLSHAAIVAREFGIPAVVGCRNATTLLKTGDRVTVDGARGTVTIEEKSSRETLS